MTNDYRIVGNQVFITLTSRIQPPREVIIPLELLPIAQAISGDWYLYKHQRTGKYYARGNDKSSGKLKQPMLHRLLMKPTRNEITTHVDGNTLDCTLSNMVNIQLWRQKDDILESIKTQRQEPTQETAIVEKPIEEATQPAKGVAFHKSKRKWEVSPFYEKVRYRLGYWPADQLELANAAVTEFRTVGPTAYFEKHPKRGGK